MGANVVDKFWPKEIIGPAKSSKTDHKKIPNGIVFSIFQCRRLWLKTLLSFSMRIGIYLLATTGSLVIESAVVPAPIQNNKCKHNNYSIFQSIEEELSKKIHETMYEKTR
jgi:hypothetical protein